MRRGKSIVLLMAASILLVLFPQAAEEANAGASIFSASIRMLDGDDALRTQTPMDIGIDSTGRIYVLYRSDQNFFYGAYMTVSDDDGRTWSRATRVDDVLRDGNSSNDFSHKKMITPRMAVGPDDTVYVVWDDWREWNEEPTLTRPANILVSKTTDGANFTEPVKVDSLKAYRSWDAASPDIEVMEDGRLFCVWLDKVDSGAYYNVWSSYSDDEGGTWSTPLLLNNDGIEFRNHYSPRCAVWGDNVYVTWHDMRDLEMGLSPFLAVSHDRGEDFSEEVLLSDDAEIGNERTHAYPEVDDEGNLYIAWNDRRTDANEIFFVRSTDNGTTLSTNQRLLGTPEGTGDSYPCLEAMGDGRILLTWNRSVPFEETKRESEAYFINSTDGGVTWGGMLRVDDTDRFEDDRTDQESVLCIFNNDGRPLCVWADTRPDNPGSTYRDLYFARNSRSLTGPNEAPMLLLPAMKGNSGFSDHIGGTRTIYNFSLVYRDEDNDVPARGFPRVMLYTDANGTDEALDDWLEMERTKGALDFYYMDGVAYHVHTNLSAPGQYFWRMEVSDGSALPPIRTPVFPGPLIDTSRPALELRGPEGGRWYPTHTVECRVRVTDTGGAGVDPASILVRKSVNGPGNLQVGVPITGYERIDNDTYEAYANVRLDMGTENYVAFEAKDRVQNGPSMSSMVNIWLDFEAPYYKEVVPSARDVQIYDDVNCSIVWRDINPGTTNLNTTGVDPDTIMWSYTTTTGPYTEWARPDGIEPLGESSYRAWKWIEFPDEGVYNFVKWTVSDNIGNIALTDPLRVRVDVPVNYRPVFKGGVWPGLMNSPTPHLWWEGAYDEENDELSYRVKLHRMPGRLEITGWFDTGHNTFFDVPDTESLTPGYYMLKVNVSDVWGGFDVVEHQFRVVDFGPAPPQDIPDFGPFNSTTADMDLLWPAVMGDGGSTVTYSIRIGRTGKDGYILEWTSTGDATTFNISGLDIPIGVYVVQVMAYQNGNFSRVTTSVLKISDYSLRLDVPTSYQVYRGKGVTLSKPLLASIVNLGSLHDNVTLYLEGELHELGWAYFDISGRSVATYGVEPSKGLAQERPLEFSVIIVPPEEAARRDYTVRIRGISEDGSTYFISKNVTVKVLQAPSDDGGSQFTDDLIDLITGILPFLGILPDSMVIPAFLVLLVLLVVVPIAIGIVIFKGRRDLAKAKDPMAERKKLYRELYGKEATEEEIREWETEGKAQKPTEQPLETAPAQEKAAEVKPPASAEGEPSKDKEASAREPEVNMDKEDKELLDRLFD